jgi:hypothetical protein
MKEEIKYALYILTLGAGLVVYAHATFATKDLVKSENVGVKEFIREAVIKRLDRIEDKL